MICDLCTHNPRKAKMSEAQQQQLLAQQQRQQLPQEQQSQQQQQQHRQLAHVRARVTKKRSRPSLGLRIIAPSSSSSSLSSHKQDVSPDIAGTLSGGVGVGTLTPNLQPQTPPSFLSRSLSLPANTRAPTPVPIPSKIDKYVLLEVIDATNPTLQICRAVDIDTSEQFICKVVPIERHQATLAPYWHVRDCDGVAGPVRIIAGLISAYFFFPLPHSDLHSYVRTSGRLSESEARRIFLQIVNTVKQCHDTGLVLRDIKLRKCIFTEPTRSLCQITGLDDAQILANPTDDRLLDKHGCPAYVSPEILHSSCPPSPASIAISGGMGTTVVGPGVVGGGGGGFVGYSGRAADIWSLGVVLYTMLAGRYPFQDTDAIALFSRIALGRYVLPDTMSPRARCLVRGMLRRDPAERLTAAEILDHPWFRSAGEGSGGMGEDDIGGVGGSALTHSNSTTGVDRNVPETEGEGEDRWFY